MFLLVLVFGISGCQTNNDLAKTVLGLQPIGSQAVEDFGRYQDLEKSKSTKTDIFKTFGQPHDVTYLSNGESVWRYYSVKTTNSYAGFIPLIGFFAQGENRDTNIADFHFTGQEKLLKYETLSKSDYSNIWPQLYGSIFNYDDELARVEAEMNKIGLPFDRKLAQRMKQYHVTAN
jgi:hypothetical protein